MGAVLGHESRPSVLAPAHGIASNSPLSNLMNLKDRPRGRIGRSRPVYNWLRKTGLTTLTHGHRVFFD